MLARDHANSSRAPVWRIAKQATQVLSWQTTTNWAQATCPCKVEHRSCDHESPTNEENSDPLAFHKLRCRATFQGQQFFDSPKTILNLCGLARHPATMARTLLAECHSHPLSPTNLFNDLHSISANPVGPAKGPSIVHPCAREKFASEEVEASIYIYK